MDQIVILVNYIYYCNLYQFILFGFNGYS